MQSQACETRLATTEQKPPPPPFSYKPSGTRFPTPHRKKVQASKMHKQRPSARFRVAGASAEIETEMGTSSTDIKTEIRRRADAVPAHLSSTQESDIIGVAFNSGVFPTPSCPRSLDPQPVKTPSTTAHRNPPCLEVGVPVGVRVVEGVPNAQLPSRAPAQMAKAQRSSFSTRTGARSRPRLP